MLIQRLSASSISSYLGCPKRFLAEQVRVRVGSAPGEFGTAMHTALDWLHRIAEEDPGVYTPSSALDLWTTVHNKYLGHDSDFLETGNEMIVRYVETQPLPAKVLSREVKETFPIVTEDGTTIDITYIMDRVDEPAPGMVKVVDYKTQWAWVTPDGMRALVQPILYAAACRRKYGVPDVEVEYLLLRHDPMNVSVVFTEADIIRFERFLADIAQRILDDDDPKERLNDKCNFCIRKAVCGALSTATDLGWTPTMPLDVLVKRREEALSAAKASEQLVKEIDVVLLDHLRSNNVPEDDIGEYSVKVTARKTGAYDPASVFEVLGPSAIPYMKVGKTALDAEVKRKRANIFTPEQREALADSINYSYGEPSIKVEKHTTPSDGVE